MPHARRGTDLTRRLAAVLVAATLLPTLAFAAALLVIQQRTLTDDALNAMEALAQVQEARVHAYLDANETNLALVTSRTQLRLSLQAALAGDDAERQRAQGIMDDAVAATPGLVHVGAFAGDGVIFAATDAQLIGQSVAGKQAVMRGLSEPSVLVDELPGGRLVQRLSGPLALDGDPFAAITVAFDLEPLLSLVHDHTGLGSTGETLLARREADGSILYLTPLRFDQDAALSRRLPPEQLGIPIVSALNGIETTLTDAVDYRGEPVVAATRSIDGVPWGLVVKQDRAEVLASIGRLRAGVVGVLVGIVALSLGLAVRGARRLAAPVEALTDTATAIATGQRDRRVDVVGAKELARLAEAFNSMADELVASEAGLEQSVVRRTNELHDALELLRRRNADLEGFSRLLAHDLRTPLTVATGLAQMLEDPGAFEPDVRADMSERLRRSLASMARITEDVMVYVTFGGGDADRVPVDLAEMVAGAAVEVGADQNLEVEGPGAVVNGDPRMLRRLFANLIGNSVKYARDDLPLEMRVTTVVRDDQVELTIRDNGIGVPPDARATVFEPFERASNSHDRHGTGLGLPMCRKIVERHGGTIVLDEVEAGASFTLTLPLSHTAPPPIAQRDRTIA